MVGWGRRLLCDPRRFFVEFIWGLSVHISLPLQHILGFNELADNVFMLEKLIQLSVLVFAWKYFVLKGINQCTLAQLFRHQTVLAATFTYISLVFTASWIFKLPTSAQLLPLIRQQQLCIYQPKVTSEVCKSWRSLMWVWHVLCSCHSTSHCMFK